MVDAMNKPVDPQAMAENDEFFVGYLPVPTGLSRWLKRAAVMLSALVVLTAAVVAALQTDPGDAVWSIDQVQLWEGVLIARPYPMLVVEEPDGKTRTHLLVSEGKRGIADRLPAQDCERVRIKGTLLQRDGRQMIEVLTTDDGFELLSAGAPPQRYRIAPSLNWTHTELRGEIIDPKCFLGAMKPGEGKTHKGCAALCLRGGIPPMFVSDDLHGRRTYHLLVQDERNPAQGALLETLATHVGDAVRVKGQAATWGDVILLRVSAGDVVRE